MAIVERDPPGVGSRLTGGDLLHSDESPPIIGESDEDQDQDGGWLKRAREAFVFSTSYVDSNYRKKWEDSIRAFNNMHALDSKYNSPNFSKRSNIYRPKPRAIIRKNEAAAAAAFFSNMDVVSVDAQNQGSREQVASAAVMKELLQYRLTKTIPWFLLIVGGYQDAQTQGVVCSRQLWEFEQKNGEIKQDRPWVKLIPVENLRIDPGAEWFDPIGTSPYVIELMPMYVGDVKQMMEKEDPKTGQSVWKRMSEGEIRKAIQNQGDSTRLARNKDRQDPYDPESRSVSDYETVWIQRHIHRKDGEDYVFYTLSDIALLTDPKPLKEEVFHGKRDYVMGTSTIETHKIYSSSVPELSKGLVEESNALANSRLDNIYFVLNKKWFVRRGKNVDVPALMRNVPGQAVMMDNVGADGDVQEINWPDITSSAYQEQDRINADFADLMGDFNPAAAQLSKKGNEPARTMQLMQMAANPLTEYSLRTLVETWVELVLRQLVLLEQHYETDQVILAIAAEKSNLFQKFNISKVTDQLLNQELTIKVNVGMGATDPMQKMQKLIGAGKAYQEFALQAPPGVNVSEYGKELFGYAGYPDGKRFFTSDDPEKDMLRQKLQHAGQIIMELGKRHEDKANEIKSKEDMNRENNNTKFLLEDLKKENKTREERGKEAFGKIEQGLKEMDGKVGEVVKELAHKVELALVTQKAVNEVEKEREKTKAQKTTPSREDDVKESKKETQAIKTEVTQVAKSLEKVAETMATAVEQIAEAMKALSKKGEKTATVVGPKGEKYTIHSKEAA